MTPGEIKSIARTMREFGIHRIKADGFEMELGLVPAGNNKAEFFPENRTTPVDAPTEASDPIKHKVEEMISVMKLSDTELVDRLFPEHSEQDEESA